MTMTISIDIEGIAKTFNAFHRLRQKEVNEVLRRVLTEITKAVAKDAQINLDSVADKASGMLRKAIKSKAVRSRKGPVRIVASDLRGEDDYYGHFIEYGFTHTGGRKISKLLKATQGKPIAPKPFLRPAFDKHEATAEQKILNAFRRYIDHAWSAMP